MQNVVVTKFLITNKRNHRISFVLNDLHDAHIRLYICVGVIDIHSQIFFFFNKPRHTLNIKPVTIFVARKTDELMNQGRK